MLCHKSASHKNYKLDVLLDSPDLSDHYPILIDTQYKKLSKRRGAKLKCSVEHIEKFKDDISGSSTLDNLTKLSSDEKVG